MPITVPKENVLLFTNYFSSKFTSLFCFLNLVIKCFHTEIHVVYIVDKFNQILKLKDFSVGKLKRSIVSLLALKHRFGFSHQIQAMSKTDIILQGIFYFKVKNFKSKN